ncbi:MAG: tail fiber protein [Betaproteobacteria bacterium]|nr:tail fiber protein [Betaproteobacteria bacterium]
MPTTPCATNQVPKWNGSAWACAALSDPRFGTNTSQGLASNGRECTLGEIILSAGFRAAGTPADGRLLQISLNAALFSLIGTTYGGNGTTNFALPDLRGAAPNGLTYTICDLGIFPSLR